ncbi:MAG TPA: hypothetical protein RMH99_18185 [Sandaracinaceae bacterium LLY-WYZ-13_1]|nr:hypothetical protein [Sandaracinaceae bacterium LLY-WYZ-13_1]
MTSGIGWLMLGALLGSLLMTGLMSAGRFLGLSRMSLPFVLGTMFTPNRDRAVPLGLAMHIGSAMVVSLLYFAVFRLMGGAPWWMGGLLGLGHGVATYLLFLPSLPGLHPRMASERDGPEPTRVLEPPGPLGLNYGKRTPLIGILAHVVFGVVVAVFCGQGMK